jgi:hypothetical protein
MRVKFFASLLVAISLGFSIPQASAADVPLLTWERGKEQNIVLGGGAITNNWQIVLIQKDKVVLQFSKSRINKEGFVVYSATIPNSLPDGSYTVQTNSENSPNSIVAGVNLVTMTRYSIAQIPGALIFLLLVLAFLTSTLSTLRSRKYGNYSYLVSRVFSETETEEMKSIPKILRRIYRIRRDIHLSIKPSLLRFNLESNGQLLHKLSPTAWAGLPLVAAIFGILVAERTQSSGGIPNTPLIIIAVIALIGVIDGFSGLVALMSFTLIQVITGSVTSLRDFMAVLSLGMGWFVPGLIAFLYLIVGAKDFGSHIPSMSIGVKRIINLFGSGAVAGTVFYASQILTESVSLRVSPQNSQLIYLSGLIGIAIALRGEIEPRIEKYRAIRPGKQKLEILNITPTKAITIEAVVAVCVFSACVAYIWTQSLQVSAISALMVSLPFALLLIRIPKLEIAFFRKIPRLVLAESIVIAFITYLVFLYIQTLPYEVNQKTQALLLFGFIPTLAHAMYSALHDWADSRELASV